MGNAQCGHPSDLHDGRRRQNHVDSDDDEIDDDDDEELSEYTPETTLESTIDKVLERPVDWMFGRVRDERSRKHDSDKSAVSSTDDTTFFTEDGLGSDKHEDETFLVEHIPERSPRCILEPREVLSAIVYQAEELVRRDPALHHGATAMSPISIDATLVDDGINSRGSGDANSRATMATSGSSFATSIGAGTAATADTQKTLPAGNFDRYMGQFGKSRRRLKPPRLKGKNVLDTLHDDLEQLMEATTRRMQGGNNLVDEENAALSRMSMWQLLTTTCTLQTHDEEEEEEIDERLKMLDASVTQHMRALHLHMASRCSDFFRTHMLKRMPHAGMTQQILNSIQSTMLSPADRQHYRRRRRQQETTPGFSTSSTSSSLTDSNAEPDFGAGPPSLPVRLLVTDTAFLDLAITGSLGMVERGHRKGHVPRSASGRKMLKSPDQYIVLINRRSGVPLAVCALKAGTSSGEPPIVRVYATKRRVFGQTQAITTEELGLDWVISYPLYTWAEIVTIGAYPDQVLYEIFMASGSDGQFEESASLQAWHTGPGSPVVKVEGRTEAEDVHTGCAILQLSRDEDSTDEADLFFQISVSRGIDPALLLCFAAFLDECMEKTMRRQCAAWAESNHRRATHRARPKRAQYV